MFLLYNLWSHLFKKKELSKWTLKAYTKLDNCRLCTRYVNIIDNMNDIFLNKSLLSTSVISCSGNGKVCTNDNIFSVPKIALTDNSNKITYYFHDTLYSTTVMNWIVNVTKLTPNNNYAPFWVIGNDTLYHLLLFQAKCIFALINSDFPSILFDVFTNFHKNHDFISFHSYSQNISNYDYVVMYGDFITPGNFTSSDPFEDVKYTCNGKYRESIRQYVEKLLNNETVDRSDVPYVFSNEEPQIKENMIYAQKNNKYSISELRSRLRNNQNQTTELLGDQMLIKMLQRNFILSMLIDIKLKSGLKKNINQSLINTTKINKAEKCDTEINLNETENKENAPKIHDNTEENNDGTGKNNDNTDNNNTGKNNDNTGKNNDNTDNKNTGKNNDNTENNNNTGKNNDNTG